MFFPADLNLLVYEVQYYLSIHLEYYTIKFNQFRSDGIGEKLFYIYFQQY